MNCLQGVRNAELSAKLVSYLMIHIVSSRNILHSTAVVLRGRVSKLATNGYKTRKDAIFEPGGKKFHNISSTNIDTCPITLPVRRNP
jgi:hypothetical protein